MATKICVVDYVANSTSVQNFITVRLPISPNTGENAHQQQ